MRFRILLLSLGLAAALRADEAPTVVTSDQLEAGDGMDGESSSVWRDHVVLTGTGIEVHCDYLKGVVSGKGDGMAASGPYGTFKYMLATGHVHIVRGEYTADCGHAEMFPQEDRIVLTENPVVTSPSGTLQGPTIILSKDSEGHRHAQVVGPSRTDVRGLKPLDLGTRPDAPPAAPAGPPIQK